MKSSSPAADRSPIRWQLDRGTIVGGNRNGQTVECLRAHRGISGFEAIEIGDWCRNNLGSEDIHWGRTHNYGWWFAQEARITQFLLVFQRSTPAKDRTIRFLTEDGSSVGSDIHWYPIQVGDRFV